MVQASEMPVKRQTLQAMLLFFLAFFAVALIVVLVISPGIAYQPDVRQAIYRYVEQMRAGNGLVFNAGERVLLIPSPLYILLLAGSAIVLSPLGVSVVMVSNIMFAFSLAVGALSLMTIANRAQLSQPIGLLIAVLYCLSWPLWNGIG